MTTYLVSTYYRGAMNVGDMRGFDNLDDAAKYAGSLMKSKYTNIRFYECYPDKQPTLLKLAKVKAELEKKLDK